jgi:general secretion pathway protein I
MKMKRRIGPRRAPGRAHSANRALGFTLIEILVAVAILAVALAATTRAASVATDGALETRQRLLATWTAENRIAEIRARRLFPTAATTRYSAEQGGLALVVDEVVSDTANPIIRRVDVAVADARDPNRILSRLTAYVSQ